MDATRYEPTSQEAREQLVTTHALALASARDQRVHARGTALIGVTFAIAITATTTLSNGGALVVSAVFFAVAGGLWWWVERTTHTVPRGAKAVSTAGLTTSTVLAMFVVTPWLGTFDPSSTPPWPMITAGAVLVAIPTLIAAALIAKRRG